MKVIVLIKSFHTQTAKYQTSIIDFHFHPSYLSVPLSISLDQSQFQHYLYSILQGPQASVFLAELLVWSAMCEIHKSEKHCILLGDNSNILHKYDCS